MLVNEKVNFGHKGPGRWVEDKCLIGVLENIPGNSVNMDKHYRNIRQEGVLKYLRRKLLSLY